MTQSTEQSIKQEVEQNRAVDVTTWPFEGATVKLAHDMLVIVKEEAERPWKVPPTVSGRVNIGMETTIFLPDLKTQKAGFTPYKLNAKGEAEDATRELLQVFRGIYLPVEAIGEK